MVEVSPEGQERQGSLCELVGQVIDGRYRITDLLGSGGMGAVYEAEHLGLGRRVAIKFIDREFAQIDSVAARFTREARAAGSVESEHIVAVYDAGQSDGRPYLVMELLRGEDLGRRLREHGKLSQAETLHIAAQALRGLADAHEVGIIHRDLKPDNLFLVSRKSDRSFVKIVDFGLSKIDRRDLGKTQPYVTRAGTVIGTPLYMSPEQAQAAPDVDARADLYSLGAIVFECLTGRPPHVGESYEQIILSICMNDAPDLRTLDKSISPEIARLVERALRRDRARRFASARQMLVAVTTVPAYVASRAVAPSAPDPVEVRMPLPRPAMPRPAEAEPLGVRTLLAGGAAEPSPAQGIVQSAPIAAAVPIGPGQTVALSPLPSPVAPEPIRVPSRPEAEPVCAEPAPVKPARPARRRLRYATIFVTGILAAAAGAGLTTWLLARYVVNQRAIEAAPVDAQSAPSARTL